jgi:hypothetical protein
MNTEPVVVRISLKDGPVRIPSLNGLGVSDNRLLWDGITATESFPEKEESAYFVVTLEKAVSDAAEVSVAEDELIRALHIIATAWPFSGGAFLGVETHTSAVHQRFESNANDVEVELLARRGLKGVKQSMALAVATSATYREPPLRIAAEIAKHATSNASSRKLLQYYHRAFGEYYQYAHSEYSSWFMSLYKVRDILHAIYKDDHSTKTALNVSRSDWSFFGDFLNHNDLRHAEITGSSPTISRADVGRLYEIARQWIVAHLLLQGLPVSQ